MNISSHPAVSTCTYCPRLCRHVCPMALGEASETLTPTHKMGLVSMIQQGVVPLDQEMAEVFYACNDCGACTAHCKHKMTPADVLYQGRQDVVAQGLAPASVVQLIERFHSHGNPYGPISQEHESTPSATQLLPGCAAWFHQPADVETIQDGLTMSSQGSSLCSSEYCCGAPLYATGNYAAHRQHANLFVQKHRHVKTLVVADPHCARHLQTRYSQVGVELPFRVVLFLHTFRPERLHRPTTSSHTPAFYLDPSPLGRHAGIYDWPRQLLQLLNYEVLEFSYHRFLALDSAAGGIYRWTSPQGALRHARWLLQEVRDYAQHRQCPAPPVVTVGETERSHLAAANPDLHIVDLNVLLAQS